MPAQELAFRKQKAVLFAVTGFDRYGEGVFAAPVEIDVRWNDRSREALSPQGRTRVFDAEAVLDRDVVEGSLLWLGRLKDFVGTNNDDIMQVIKFDATPDIKGRAVFRLAKLMRYKGGYPGSA